MARVWLRRGLGVFVLGLIGVGAWAGLNRDLLQAKYALHRFSSATTEEERTKWADALAARDPQSLIPFCANERAEIRAASATALERLLESIPPGDPHGGLLAGQVLDAFASAGESERDALAALLPIVVQRAGASHAAKSRVAVETGLKSTSAAARVSAIQAAASLSMRAAVVPLLSAPEAEVRSAALFAVGPVTADESVIGDEDLFHWLHDADADARRICRAALISRGRSDVEIGLGKKLVDPDAAERLKLLFDLRFEDELSDVEPWLERLSRDEEPGVRTGAVRVMMEISRVRGLPVPGWVSRVAEADPDPTVRRAASYFRSPPAGAPDAAIRLIEGP